MFHVENPRILQIQNCIKYSFSGVKVKKVTQKINSVHGKNSKTFSRKTQKRQNDTAKINSPAKIPSMKDVKTATQYGLSLIHI